MRILPSLPAIPGTTNVKLTLLLIWTVVVACVSWDQSVRFHETATIANTPHPQRSLGNGAVLAERDPAPLVSATLVTNGAHAKATFHADIEGGAPVLRPGTRVADSAPAGAAASGADLPTKEDVANCQRWLECEATSVDGTEEQNPDGTTDLVLRAGGRRIRAKYNPGPTAQVPVRHPLGIGAGYSTAREVSAVMTYDFAALPVTAGAEVGRGQAQVFAVIHLW